MVERLADRNPRPSTAHNEEFDETVWVTGAPVFMGWQAFLAFDTNLLQVTNQVVGGLPGPGFFVPDGDPTDGGVVTQRRRGSPGGQGKQKADQARWPNAKKALETAGCGGTIKLSVGGSIEPRTPDAGSALRGNPPEALS